MMNRPETVAGEHAVRPYDVGRERDAVDRYRRCVNYLAAAQIYLRANPLLEEPLRPDHIKDRLLGHRGTAPGINFMYLHLNRLIRCTKADILLITGPGHGAAANLANMYLEGSLTEYFPQLTRDRQGLQQFVRWFSWPDKFPSHLSPIYRRHS
jgi:xylulose-5-phosphate/fructose-6-phosphate phosphoketolase